MITIQKIERTNLSEAALVKLIKKFSNPKKDLRLTFDARISDHGSYTYNIKKKRHEIKVSSRVFQFRSRSSKPYELIGTIIHELKHVQQQEDLGTNTFFSEKHFLNKCIKNEAAAAYYSTAEIEARIFEEKNLLAAVDFYCKNNNGVLE